MKVCVSEKDAVQRMLCPMIIGSAEMRHGGSNTCAGGRCMAWRWVRTNIQNEDGIFIPSDDTHGYCGLAGNPND